MHLATARAHSAWLLLATCALAGNAAAQDSDNCEAIRAQIESKIAASGVVGFRVTVADTNARANTSGQVVDSCAMGTREIVYTRPSSAGTDNAAPTASPRGSAVLTECKDGSAPVGGHCKP